MADLINRTRWVYALLMAALGLVAAWQVMEHNRVKHSAREALVNRSRDITTTLGLVIRSQRRFGGIVSQERLESALNELVKSGELGSVALLNATGEVVASAGTPIELDTRGMMRSAERWDHKSVTVVNLVDLGASVAREGETNRPTIVLPRRDPSAGPREEGPSSPPPFPRLETGTNEADSINGVRSDILITNTVDRGGPGRRGPFGPRSGRPPWMDEKEYQTLLERRGLHGLVVAMSTAAFRRTCVQDLWMRCVIGGFASISVFGLGLAWRNVAKSSELQMRLLRASELNTHLKEMNLAAAGLAHETRNPLNIIRGMAQMISKQGDTPPAVRSRTREIIDETDRVTAQLNEFINYSRPREVRRSAVPLGSVVGEVVRALNYDIEEKQIRLQVAEEQLAVEADEQLLRQALFNLLLNAIQAVEPNGEIQIVASKVNAAEAFIEVRDNGPGVLPEHRADIFKPYFTTHQKGTGLGLAVVQQIVLAHGWEIECRSHEPRGAIFRISHLKPVAKP
jgi:signal transduction histidine kinase